MSDFKQDKKELKDKIFNLIKVFENRYDVHIEEIRLGSVSDPSEDNPSKWICRTSGVSIRIAAL